MTSTEHAPAARRWVRRLGIAAILGLVCLFGLALALPLIIETPWAQRKISAEGSKILAPSRIQLDHVRVSWFRPTEITGVSLFDAQGDKIVAAPTAQMSWSLWDIVFRKPVVIQLILNQANIDIERSRDGSIDLLETLKPVLSDEPDHSLLIRVVDGRLRCRDATLANPILAEKANINLDLNAYPQPIAWDMALEHARDGGATGKVQFQGSSSRQKDAQGSPDELAFVGKAQQWPFDYATDSVSARGVLDGQVDYRQKTGQVGVSVDGKMTEFDATGSALSGDQLRLDTISVAVKAERRDQVWTAQQLDLTSPIASINATGSLPPSEGREAHLKGEADLAALASQLPKTLRLKPDLRIEKGTATFQANVSGDPNGNGQIIDATGKLADLVAMRGDQRLTLPEPPSLSARIHRQEQNLSVEVFDVATSFLTARGSGDLDRGIDVAMTIDLGAASQSLRDWIDLGKLSLNGKGEIQAHYVRSAGKFEGTAKSEFQGLSLKGLPAIDSFEREKLVADLKADGIADPSGWPETLQNLSLVGRSEGDELAAKVVLDPATRATSASLNGKSTLVLNGKKQTAEAIGNARWNEQEVMIDALSFVLTPVVGPGGQFLPTPSVKWTGKGSYNIPDGSLVVTAEPLKPDEDALSPAVMPSRIRAGGLRTSDAAWVEISLAGDLSRLRLGPESDSSLRLGGLLDGTIQLKQNPENWDLNARLRAQQVTKLQDAGEGQLLADEATANLRAQIAKGFTQADVLEMSLVTPYGRVEGRGPITELSGSPRFDLAGTVSPDWTYLTQWIAREVEPNASIAGTPHGWKLSGTLPDKDGVSLLQTVNGEIGVNLDVVDVFGMRLGTTTIVARARDGKIEIDPIDATLNSGRLHLEPTVVTDKQGITWLHFGPTSALMDAVVNEEVSQRVLAYAASALYQATRVRGRVSLSLNEAFIPIAAGPDVQARIDGDILFDSVEFMPGPFLDQLIGLFKQERRPLLVLHDPVSVRIVGRTIYQEGLIIPLGTVAAIGIEGAVDFDQNIDLVASFAFAPPRKEVPVLSDLLANTQIQVPIKGTFKNPKIDGDAIGERFKNMGLNMLDSLIGVGANGLGRIIQGRPGRGGAPPPDFFPPFEVPDRGGQPVVPRAVPAPPGPDGQPDELETTRKKPSVDDVDPDDELDQPAGDTLRLTPRQEQQKQQQLKREERKNRRLEKRAERRMKRGLPPE